MSQHSDFVEVKVQSGPSGRNIRNCNPNTGRLAQADSRDNICSVIVVLYEKQRQDTMQDSETKELTEGGSLIHCNKMLKSTSIQNSKTKSWGLKLGTQN